MLDIMHDKTGLEISVGTILLGLTIFQVGAALSIIRLRVERWWRGRQFRQH